MEIRFNKRFLKKSMAVLMTASLSLFSSGISANATTGSVAGNISVLSNTLDCGDSTTVTMSLAGLNGITQNPVDVVLVLDESGSIAAADFKKIKDAAKKFIDILDRDSDGQLNGTIGNGSRIGVVRFASTADVALGLTNSANALNNLMNIMTQRGGTTNTTEAFNDAQALLTGSQPNNKKIMVMFTDGLPNNGTIPQTQAAAKNARDAGTEIYTIGIGSADLNQLKNWASDPDADHVFMAPSYEQLETIFQGIGAAIVTPAATNISIKAIVNSSFAVSNVSSTMGTPSLSGNEISWNITTLGSENATLTYTITGNGIANGSIPINDSVTYSDHEGQSVTFNNPVVNVTGCDTQAPVTETVLSGDNHDGWYKEDVHVTLNATDDQSGVNKTEYQVNDSGWQTYQGPFDVKTEGENKVEFKSTDNVGNVEVTKSVTVKIDKTAPTTTVSSVNDGWYNSNVALSLVATDPLSSVDKTEYQVNGGGWQTYNGEFTVTTEGENTVQYRSTDKAGNVEGTKSVTVKIDKTAPTLNVSFNPSVITVSNHKLIPIKATLNGKDTLSNIDSIKLISIVSNQPDNGTGDGDTVNDIQGADLGTPDTEFLLRAERSGSGDRIYTVTYLVSDKAGNTATVSGEIIVKHDNSKK